MESESDFIDVCRAVTNSQGPGIFPGYYEGEPWLLLQETKGKQSQKNFQKYNSPPSNCIYLAPWNFSDSPDGHYETPYWKN